MEDEQGNAVPAASATFEVDTDAPTVTFAPADGTKTGNADVNVVLTFNEPVRKANGDPLDNAAAAAAVSLKKDGSGPDLAVSGRVTVNGGKTVITIDPQNALTPGRYTATLAANAVEDEQGNGIGTDRRPPSRWTRTRRR